MVSSFSDNVELNLRLKAETKTEPIEHTFQKDAEVKLYRELEKSQTKKKLSKYLGEQLDTEVTITKIQSGSILIDLKIRSTKALEGIKYLSDQGVLSNMVGSVILTRDFVATCRADNVYMVIKLDEESYLAAKRQVTGNITWKQVRIYFHTGRNVF